MIKKIIRMIILLTLIFPIAIQAENIESNIISEYETYNVIKNSIEINEFKLFKKDSNTFGISGTIKNNSSQNVTYDLMINYYNINNELVYNQIASNEITKESYKNVYISNNINDINNMLDISQIAYYSLELSTYDKTMNKINYTISKHNVDIKILNSNIYEVTENITVNYLEENQQFIKEIPLNYQEDLYNKVKISNILIDSS